MIKAEKIHIPTYTGVQVLKHTKRGTNKEKILGSFQSKLMSKFEVIRQNSKYSLKLAKNGPFLSNQG